MNVLLEMTLYACFLLLTPPSFTSLIPLTHHSLGFSFLDVPCVEKKLKHLYDYQKHVGIFLLQNIQLTIITSYHPLTPDYSLVK